MTRGSGRKPLLPDGAGLCRLAEVAARTAVRRSDIAALIEGGRVPGGVLRDDGTAWGFLEDQVPTRELLLELGARPADGPEVDNAEEWSGTDGSGTWEIRF